MMGFLSGLFGGGGSGGGTTTTIQNADPWIGSQPYLKDYMSNAKKAFYNDPIQYYPGNTVAGFDPATNSAFSGMLRMANNPMSATNRAIGQVNQTMSGSYLPGGGRFNAITDPVTQAVNSQFESAGRYGSGMHQQAVAKGMMEAMQPYYDAERGRMMTASAMAPSADMAHYAPMLQVGQSRQGMNQSRIDANMARFNFGQEEPWQRLQRYASLVSPGAGFGSSGTSSQKVPGGSPWAGAIGGGMAAGALANAMPGLTSPFGFMGGWPLIAGGALLGAFG